MDKLIEAEKAKMAGLSKDQYQTIREFSFAAGPGMNSDFSHALFPDLETPDLTWLDFAKLADITRQIKEIGEDRRRYLEKEKADG